MTQNQRVLRYLKTGRPLTAATAVGQWGIYRLAARIKDLRDEGHPIRSRLMTLRGKRFAAYWL